MCSMTELRDSAKTKKSGTILLPSTVKQIPTVVKKGDHLFYVEGNGKLRFAEDLDPMPISELPLSQIPPRLLTLVAGKQLAGEKIILYARN